MVNTFLTHSNFRISAASLDRQRLGKQRVEAYQILCLLETLDILSDYFNIPYQHCNLKDWISEISYTYKKLDHYLYIRNNKICKLNKTLLGMENKKVQKSIIIRKILKPNDKPIFIGYINNPTVRMWYGYKEALKLYINCHIDEWILRGYNNTMKYYDIDENINIPLWCYDNNIIKNHRSSLLQKEKDRNEPAWYIKQSEFLNLPPFINYIWPISDRV